MNKKFLAKLLALCMVVSMLPTAAFATGEDQTNPGNNAYYTITGDATAGTNFATEYTQSIIKLASGGKLTVAGNSSTLAPLTSGAAKTFVVPSGTTLNLTYVTASDAVYITGNDVTVDPATPAMLALSRAADGSVVITDAVFQNALVLEKVAVTFKGTNKMENLVTTNVTTPGSVILDANGGNFGSDDVKVKAIEYSATLDATDDYDVTGGGTFKGWSEDGTGTGVPSFDNGKTYKAIWSTGGGGGGGGGSSSSVSVKSTTGGKVSISPANPKKGQTVTITPKPNAGYELVSITVKDSKGNEIEVTRNSDGTYSFVMPAGRVTITPNFEKIEGIVANFSDVKENDWFAEAVKFVTDKGIMTGVGEGRFAPQTTTSRAMLVQMLYALEGKPNAGSASFTDVSSGDWFADAVAWANAKGIVTGLGDGKFGPNNNLTREQMALILYGYAKMKGYDVTAKGDMSAYADQTSISSWASEAMAWAVGAGMISGRTTTTLVPGGIATRAEMAQIMMRFCENVAK